MELIESWELNVSELAHAARTGEGAEICKEQGDYANPSAVAKRAAAEICKEQGDYANPNAALRE